MMTETVNAKDLFATVDEGDELMFGDRTEPVTVYRHVTEDDLSGQVLTLSTVRDEIVAHVHREQYGVDVSVGDLVTGELTGDEFLIARGPRGGCYLLKQWWTKRGGQWFADVALYRRTRADRKAWAWENTVNVSVVGHTDVDRDAFDEGGDWTRHTEVAGRTVWTDLTAGDVWAHSAALTGTEPEDSEDGPAPWETLETVSEGDVVTVNGRTGTVTDVSDEYGGVLADGVMVTLDVDGDEYRVRTFAADEYAALMSSEVSEDVTDVERAN